MKKDFNYIRVYRDIKEKISSGEYASGDRLPTEAELGAEYGISRITVKKAMELLANEKLIERFPGKGTFVSEQTVEKKTNENADGQYTIGLVMSGFSSSFGQEFLCGVSEEANRKGCSLMVGLCYNSLQEETELIDRLIAKGADGIIAMAFHSEAGINMGIVNSAINKFPMVMADRYLEGISLPYVGSNHVDAAFRATQYLFSLGHKNIGFISSAPTTTAITERESGYMKAYAMTKFQASPRNIINDIKSSMPGHRTRENIRHDIDRMKSFYRDNPDITALLCVDYNIMKICESAAKETGLRIPENISTVCFDAPDDGFAQLEYTHIKQNEREIGTQAVQLLIDAINGCDEPKYILVPAELCVGMSAASPRP